VEKQKKFSTEQWFFLVNFRTVATNFFLEEIGKIRFNSLSSREKCSKNGKNWQCLQTAKLRKKEKEKENAGTEVYICVHSKNMMEKHVVKLTATLDEGPRSRDQWIQAILYINSLSPSVWHRAFWPVNGLCDADSATPQKWVAETDSATYLLLFLSFFYWICFFEFFSLSLKLTKMKKQNKK